MSPIEKLLRKIMDHRRDHFDVPKMAVLPAIEWIGLLNEIFEKSMFAAAAEPVPDLDAPVYFEGIQILPEHNGIILTGNHAAKIWYRNFAKEPTKIGHITIGKWRYAVMPDRRSFWREDLE